LAFVAYADAGGDFRTKQRSRSSVADDLRLLDSIEIGDRSRPDLRPANRKTPERLSFNQPSRAYTRLFQTPSTPLR
jgi:hypothetical protein